MRTICTNVYQFDELSETAKESAILEMSHINNFDQWWDFIYDDAKTIGLNITSFDIERNKHAKGEFLLSAFEVCANVFLNHGETCDTYKTALSFMDQWQPVFNAYMDEKSEHYESNDSESIMQDMESSLLDNMLSCYADMLQKESGYLQSKEAIVETIKANEYEFTENGKLI